MSLCQKSKTYDSNLFIYVAPTPATKFSYFTLPYNYPSDEKINFSKVKVISDFKVECTSERTDEDKNDVVLLSFSLPKEYPFHRIEVNHSTVQCGKVVPLYYVYDTETKALKFVIKDRFSYATGSILIIHISFTYLSSEK